MQDIDFDEIDRAVNSITNSSTDAQTPSAPIVNSAPVETPASGSVDSEVSQPLAPPVASPASRRSSGRFMDVVHPSSDMRPPVSSRPAPFAPSLHREDDLERAEVTNAPVSATTQGSAFHWPDPLDMTIPTPAPVESPAEKTEPALADPVAEVAEETPSIPEPNTEQNKLDAPLESPFLTDAKVEKRPLGAFSGADADLALIEDPIPVSANATPVPEEVPPPVEEPAHEEHDEVPHELHPDLLALDGHSQNEKQAADPLPQATIPSDSTPSSAVEDIPVGPTSITQQYKEQPSSDTGQSGSIFDTEAYHQALTHPPKKRSSVLIIVWIITLILVGGGIGAGIYYVVLPMLG